MAGNVSDIETGFTHVEPYPNTAELLLVVREIGARLALVTLLLGAGGGEVAVITHLEHQRTPLVTVEIPTFPDKPTH